MFIVALLNTHVLCIFSCAYFRKLAHSAGVGGAIFANTPRNRGRRLGEEGDEEDGEGDEEGPEFDSSGDEIPMPVKRRRLGGSNNNLVSGVDFLLSGEVSL